MLNPSVHTDDARFLELLERWLTGDFTRSDEGELHALAAADPFRREAWEGFSALPEAQHQLQLERLRRHILGRPARRVALSRWMAAAAVLLLLLAAVYFIPDWQVGQDAQPMAKSNETAANTPEPAKPSNDVATVADDFSTSQPAPSATTVKPKGSVFATDDQRLAEQETAVSSEEKSGEPDVELFNPSRSAKAKTRSEPGPVRVDGPASNDNFQHEAPAGAVVLTSPAPVPNADSIIADRAAAVLKDADMAGPPKAPAKSVSVAQPVGGWDAFHLFVRKNARLPEAAKNKNVSGSVRLEFTVGPDFKPANTRVLQALGYGCEEEAQRLIDLFNWGPPGALVVVELPFVR